MVSYLKTLRCKSGFTLVEVLVTSVILAISLGGIIALFFYCFSLNERSREYAMAIAEAQDQLEELRATQTVSAEVFDLNQLNGKGVIYVDSTNSELIQIKIVICWQSSRDGRNIGEDENLNGILDAGEDLNGNLELDSPVMFTTLLARRY